MLKNSKSSDIRNHQVVIMAVDGPSTPIPPQHSYFRLYIVHHITCKSPPIPSPSTPVTARISALFVNVGDGEHVRPNFLQLFCGCRSFVSDRIDAHCDRKGDNQGAKETQTAGQDPHDLLPSPVWPDLLLFTATPLPSVPRTSSLSSYQMRRNLRICWLHYWHGATKLHQV